MADESDDRATGAGLPEAYQHALVETVVDLDVVTELVRHNLEDEEIRRVLHKLSHDDRDAFTAKLTALLRKTAALLLIARRMSDSLLVEVLLPRLVVLISDFLDAERCSVFLHDPDTDELYTKTAVGVAAEIRFPARLGIAGAVFASGEPLLIPDAYAHPSFNAEVDGRTGFRTRDMLCAPLRHIHAAGARTVGVIQVLNRRKGQFNVEDLKLLEALSAQAAAALANALLHEAVTKARAGEARLLEETAAISQTVELRTLLAEITRTAVLVLDAERVTFYVQDPRTRELWALAGQSAEVPARAPSHPETAAAVFASGQTVNVTDPRSDPRVELELDRGAAGRTRSLLCMPVRNRAGEVTAVAEALNRRGGPFTVEDELRLRAFCSQAAIVMENTRLLRELDLNVAHLASLLEASKALAAAVDVDSQLDVIATRACAVMGAERAAVFVYDEGAETLLRHGPGAEAGRRVPLSSGIAANVAHTGTPANVPDAAADWRFDPAVDGWEGAAPRAVLCAPLFTHRRRLIGVLEVVDKSDGGPFTRHDEVLLEAFASHAALALDRARLVEASLEKRRMEDSLRFAHDIQMAMLPRAFPRRPELELAARLVPARSVGGDLYDFVTEEDRLWIVVGDVSGKGVGPALFMAAAKALFRTSMSGRLAPAEVLTRVGRELWQDNDRGLFVTAFAACLDLRTGELAFSNAGHNLPYRRSPSGELTRIAGGHGLPLGIVAECRYEPATLRLGRGDALYVYTDGVTEALNREGDEFTVSGLEALLARGGELDAEALVSRTFDAVKAFAGDAPQSDDITVLALRYLA